MPRTLLGSIPKYREEITFIIRFVSIMFQGQDTTSTTLGFALSLLGIYQDVQVRLYSNYYDSK